MTYGVLQTSIDISVPGTTPEQQAVAWVAIGIAVLVTAWRIWTSHYAGLPSRLKRAKADLRGARQDTTLLQAYLGAEEAGDPEQVRETAASLLDGEHSGDPRVRDAAQSVGSALTETWAPHWLRLPKTTRRLGALAVLVTVLGSVAVSTELLLGLFESAGPQMVPLQWPRIAVTYTIRVGELSHELLQGLPIVGPTLSFTFTLVITSLSLAFPAWYVWATLLLIGAAGLGRLESSVADGVTPDWSDHLPSAGSVGRTVALGGLLIWGFVLAGIGLGRLVGPAQLGTRFGLAAGLGAVLTLSAIGAVRLSRHRDELPSFTRIRDADPEVQQYLVLRYASFAAAAVAGALVPIYAAVALTKLPVLIRGFMGANTGVQALVLLAAAIVVGTLAWQAREAWGDVQSALAITAARQQVRALVIGTGLPIVVVGITYAIISGLTSSIPLGVAAAVGAGLLARVGLSLVTRVRYRAGLYDPTDQPARRVVIEAAPLETRDGAQEYVRINGDTELLHPDRDQLLEDVAAVTGELVDQGEADKPISEWHAEFAFDLGITDPEETEAKLVERPRKRLYHELRSNGGRVPVERVDEETEEFPDEYVDGLLWREEFHRGCIQTTENYVVLRNDPYSR